MAKKTRRQIAKELRISNPFFIQFMARGNDFIVIECNHRASRSFPFESKVQKISLFKLATKSMLNPPAVTAF